MKCFLFSNSNGFTTFDNLKLTLLLQLPLQHFALFSKGVYYIQTVRKVLMFALVQKFRLSLPTFSLFYGISSQCTVLILNSGISYFHSLGCSLLQTMYQNCSQFLMHINHLLTHLSHNRKPIPNTNVDSKWNFW